MESVFSGSKECWECGTTSGLHEHHIFMGPDRDASEKHGLKLYLCFKHHEQVHMHPNTGLDKELKEMGQRYYLANIGCLDDFRAEFRKSYL